MDQSERQSDIGAGIYREMTISGFRGASLDGSMTKNFAPFAGPPQSRPKMNVRFQDVRAPRNNQPRVGKLFWLHAKPNTLRQLQTSSTGGGADRAVEPRSAKTMKESPVHPRAVEKPHGSRRTIGKDRLGAIAKVRWPKASRLSRRARRPKKCARISLRL